MAALVRNTGLSYNPRLRRGVAQPGRALSSGGRGRWFESSHPDHCFPFKANCIRLLKIQARSRNSSPGTQLGRNLLYFTKNDACTDRLPSQIFTIFSRKTVSGNLTPIQQVTAKHPASPVQITSSNLDKFRGWILQARGKIRDSQIGIFFQGAFPNDQHPPSQSTQCRLIGLIADNVACQLFKPEFSTCAWGKDGTQSAPALWAARCNDSLCQKSHETS